LTGETRPKEPESTIKGAGTSSTGPTDAGAAETAVANGAAADAQSTQAGRGGIAILGAKVYFIATGFLQQPLLPMAMGLAGYGALSRVLAIANVFNNVVVSACTQGMSRAVAQSKGHEKETLRRLFPAHAALALGAALLLACLTPVFARFESAPYIQAPLFVMAGLLAVYGVYAPLVGFLNGSRRFGRQASLDVTAATLRTVLLVGGGYLFARRGLGGALGATAGALLAALCVFFLAYAWTRGRSQAVSGDAAHPALISTRAYVLQLLPIALSQLFTNALMQSDLTLLGRFLSHSAHDLCAPAAPEALAACMTSADKTADEWVAVYRACQLFAFLPYQLLFSVTQVLFPMLAKTRASGNKAEVARLTSRGARLGVVVVGLPVSVVLALPWSCIAFAYGKEVATRGEDTLRVLALGQMAFAVLSLGATVLVSLGREVRAMLLTLTAVLLVFGACFLLVPGRTFGGAQLHVTATAASIALAAGMAVSFALVVREAGAFVPAATMIRVALAVLCAWGLGHVMPHAGRLLLVPLAAGVVVMYVAILTATRELGKSDAAWLMGLAKKRR
jgi:stage V sporulation protein B